MAITLIGTESNNVDGTAVMTLLVPPGTQDGDIILFFGSSDGGTVGNPLGFEAPAGFTLLVRQATAGSHTNDLFFKIADNEPASFNIETRLDRPTKGIGIFATYRGQDITSPIDQFNVLNGGSSKVAEMTPVTPGADGSGVAIFIGTERGHGSIVPPDIISSKPAEITIQLDNVNAPTGNGNSSSSAAFLDVIQTTAQEVSGMFGLDLTGDTFWGTYTIVVRPLLTGSAGSASGIAIVLGIGESSFAAQGLIEGVAVVSGVGDFKTGADGSIAGQATVTAIGVGAIGGAGSAAGQAVANADGSFIGGGVGLIEGEAVVLGVGARRLAALGNAQGLAIVLGVGESAAEAVGLSQGIAEALAIGDFSETGKMVGSIEGVAVVVGVGGGLGGGVSTGVRSGQGMIRRRTGMGRIVSSTGGGFLN